MEVLTSWSEMLVRWVHVIAGIGWIGSSFYFVHLDLSLKSGSNLPEKASGDAWQVHGGGFYHMVKYMVAPDHMPSELTWFKWEAYATWITGMGLLVIVFYLEAELFLIDRSVLDISAAAAILISIGSLIAGWIIYDLLCRSPLGKNELLLGVVGFVFLTLASYLFTLIFSSRGAFVHIGALIGTIMVANVLMVVIPGQRKVVAALIKGEKPEAIHGIRGKQRSVHNNYLTLPVIFIMVSNHYPLAFATRWNWVIVSLTLLIGVVIRHFYNTRHKGEASPWWTWAVAAICMVAIVWLSQLGPANGARVQAEPSAEVAMGDVEEVIIGRCSMCHAREPLWEGIIVPPKGVILEDVEHIRKNARNVAMQAVWTRAMPPGNITEMEQEERQLLANWYAGLKK